MLTRYLFLLHITNTTQIDAMIFQVNRSIQRHIIRAYGYLKVF